jgi:hypothetical protein
MDVFVLGFPFGIGPWGGPNWKRGSIASEPKILNPEEPYFLLDTASRPGMSGSPIIRRSWGFHLMEDGGSSVGSGFVIRFIGIYSGRIAGADPIDAQLGMGWPKSLIEEIVIGKNRDT